MASPVELESSPECLELDGPCSVCGKIKHMFLFRTCGQGVKKALLNASGYSMKYSVNLACGYE
jgi:hypothetical protein